MATKNNNRNRATAYAGNRASRLSRQVSASLRRLGHKANGRDAVLHGVVCRAVGDTVSVRVGHLPSLEADAIETAAEVAAGLRGMGYEVTQTEWRMTVTHPTW